MEITNNLVIRWTHGTFTHKDYIGSRPHLKPHMSKILHFHRQRFYSLPTVLWLSLMINPKSDRKKKLKSRLPILNRLLLRQLDGGSPGERPGRLFLHICRDLLLILKTQEEERKPHRGEVKLLQEPGRHAEQRQNFEEFLSMKEERHNQIRKNHSTPLQPAFPEAPLCVISSFTSWQITYACLFLSFWLSNTIVSKQILTSCQEFWCKNPKISLDLSPSASFAAS